MSTGEPIHFEHHDAHLAGSLYKPDSPEPVPLVIVLHSASGGLRTNRFYEHLTTSLPACGIAVFVYDRRGSGESTGSFETADFALLAADAQAAIAVLTARSDIDQQRIGLYGISQGGWIAPRVAARNPSVSLLVIVSGCGVTPAEQMIYSAQTALREAHYPEATIAEATQLRHHVDAYYRGTLQRSVVQAELDAVHSEPWFPLAYVNAELPENVQQSKWYLEMDYEPLAVWRQVHQPTLFLYGDHDRWVPIEKSIDQYRAATVHIDDTTIVQIEGADHLMTHPNATSDAETSGQVSEVYLAQLQAWLCQRFGIAREK